MQKSQGTMLQVLTEKLLEILTGKHLSLLFTKLQAVGLQLSVNFAKFLKHAFFIGHLRLRPTISQRRTQSEKLLRKICHLGFLGNFESSSLSSRAPFL